MGLCTVDDDDEARDGFNFFSRNFIRMLAMYVGIKIYGNDGNIIQFSVFMAHFGRRLRPTPPLASGVSQEQTWKKL